MNRQKQAKGFAYDAAVRIKNSYTPYTGRSVSAKVVSVSYSESMDVFEIEIEAHWNAKGCALCRRKDHQVNGLLTVLRNREMQFSPTWKNNAVEKTENWIEQTGLLFSIGSIITLGVDLQD